MNFLKRLLYLLFALALAFGLYAAYLELTGNVHTVIPDQVYRSAQLTPEQLQTLITQDHLRSIIDLAPGMFAHAQELVVSHDHHVAHYDLQLHAYSLPSVADLKTLVVLLDTAPRPLLIHCHSGVDRTGLASAIVLILTPNTPVYKIKLQYSWLYLALSPNSVGKLVLDRYFQWLEQNGRSSSPENFQDWLRQLQT